MAKKKTEPTIEEVIDQIALRLDAMEELMSFMVRSNTRFKKGQRVQFSPKAAKAGLTRGNPDRRGTVVQVGESFSMKVLLDGYKRPHSFHHSFFNPIR